MTKILLVEDDKSLREIYGVRLLAEGYDIVSAGDGEEALAMAIKEKPSLIISDVMMPKISGFDMLDILRSTTETRDIKIIMMTALSSDDQRNRGEQLGADRYLVKSQVGIEDVVRTVHEVMEDKSGTDSAPAPTSTPTESTDAAKPSEDVSAAAEPASTDASSSSDAATTSTQAEPVSTPMPTTDDAKPAEETPAPSPVTASPGNEEAGPLPPQPAITTDEPESSLPQPTAPFSSPRPATLGERIVQPIGDPTAPTISPEVIEQELQAATDQPSTAPAPEVTPSADPTPTIPPAAPAVDLEAPTVPDTTPLAVAPTDLSSSPIEEDKKDDTSTPPLTPSAPTAP